MSSVLQFLQKKRFITVVCLALLVALVSNIVWLFGQQGSTKSMNIATAESASADQQWSYLPGSVQEGNKIRINDRSFAISSQNGATYQPNPPVNLYGTHYAVNKSFTTSADLEDITADAYLTLYGKAPITQDEFRVEPARVDLHFTPQSVEISVYKNSNGKDIGKTPPVFRQIYSRESSSSAHVLVKRAADTLTVVVDNHMLATIPENNVFSNNQLWFGARAKGNSFLLSNISVAANDDGSVQSLDSSSLQVKNDGDNTLQALAAKKRPDFVVGSAMSLAPIVSDAGYRQLAFGGQFGSMTTENSLKWQFTEPHEGVFDFKEGDALVDMATRHNIKVHGHTLVFSEANPQWIHDLPTASSDDKKHVEEVMKNHITTMIGHYKSKISSWDVVNEPLADYDTFDSDSGAILRSNKWLQAMGASYIATAFHTAHQADPDAKLFINEYGLEEEGDRWNTFLDLVTQLKQQGVPIDGVGFQAHVYEAADKINPAVMKKHIQQLAKIGLVARVSEMDVYDDDGEATQAQQYKSVFDMCINEPNCISWTTWGVSDRYDMFLDDSGKPEFGNDFLWDSNMKPTQGLVQIERLLTN